MISEELIKEIEIYTKKRDKLREKIKKEKLREYKRKYYINYRERIKKKREAHKNHSANCEE